MKLEGVPPREVTGPPTVPRSVIGALVKSLKDESSKSCWSGREENYSVLLVDVCLYKQKLSIQRASDQCLRLPAAQVHSLADQMQTMAATASPSGVAQGNQDLAPTITEMQREIVTLVEEGDTSAATSVPDPTRGFLAPGKDNLTNSVVGFLSRPYEFRNFAWNSTANRGALLTSVNFPRDYLNIPAVKEKIAGFRYLRANFHMRVQVNAQPMNAGRLFMLWQPFFQSLTNTPASALTISGLTGYPMLVELDLADDTSFETMAPYVGTTSHFDLIKGAGTSGTIQVYVYSPLTGLSEVDATIWIWASEVDIQLPTGLPAQQIQSDDTPFVHPTADGTAEFSVPDAPPQNSPPEKEKKTGIMSKILDIGGRIAMAGGAIPTLGPFLLAGGAIARGFGKLASIFGWSKPMVDVIPTHVRPMFLRHLANYNGPFDGKQMAFDWDNQTDIPAFMYGTEEDEMALAYILQRPVFTTAFTMDASNNPGTVLFKWPVDPQSCLKQANPLVAAPAGHESGTQSNNTYMSYLSHLFNFWRGSLCYELAVVKTVFHSGRVKVVYVPGADMTTDYATVDDSKCYTKVYDLRQTNKIDVCVPYNWYTPWKALDEIPAETSNPAILLSQPQGMLYVVVVNSLRNPTTVANHVEFIVKSRAGEDFQFAIPGLVNNTWPLIDNFDTQTELSAAAPEGRRLGGEIQAAEIFGNPTTSDVTINALGVGEVITSFRQLLKRFMPLPSGIVNVILGRSTLDVYRGISDTASPTTPADTLARLQAFTDMYRWAVSLYRFYSGPMRFSAIWNVTTPQAGAVTFRLNPAGIGLTPFSDVSLSNGVGWSYSVAAIASEPVIEMEVPFYQRVPALLTDVGRPLPFDELNPVANTDAYKRTVLPIPSLVELEAPTTWDQFNAWRHIGERFSFGLMLGPPPTISFRKSI